MSWRRSNTWLTCISSSIQGESISRSKPARFARGKMRNWRSRWENVTIGDNAGRFEMTLEWRGVVAHRRIPRRLVACCREDLYRGRSPRCGGCKYVGVSSCYSYPMNRKFNLLSDRDTDLKPALPFAHRSESGYHTRQAVIRRSYLHSHCIGERSGR